MTAAITVGRLGLDTAEIEWADSLAHGSGDELTVSAILNGSSLAELRALRQAALGLHGNPDEPVVPFTFSDDSWFDGYYRVGGVSVSYPSSALASFWLPVTFQLERIHQYAAPLIEARVAGALRSNVHSITIAEFRTWHCPGSENYEGYREVFPNRLDEERETADGVDASLFVGGTGAGRDHFTDAFPGWHMPPASYYEAAARLEIAGVPAVGRQIPNLASGASSWQLSNGIVRVRPDTVTAGHVVFECWRDGAWEEADTDLFWGWYSAGYHKFPHPHTITVLANTPEMVAIRLTYTGPVAGGLSDEFVATVDLVVRRGANYVEGYLDAGATSTKWCVGAGSTTASTSLTGGVRQTSDSADGNRLLLASPATYTEDLVEGAIYLTSNAATFPFMIGWELDGSSSSGLDDDQETIYAYHCAHYERARVVAR